MSYMRFLGKCKPILILFSLLYFLFPSQAQEHFVFSIIDASQGLSDNRVRYLFQLPDGRMIVTTDGGLNLYDGTTFSYLHRQENHIYPLEKYQGSFHEYLYEDSLLFIKDYQTLVQVNLNQEKYESAIPDYFVGLGIQDPITDLFIDKEQNLWLLTDKDELYVRLFTSKQLRRFLSSISRPSGTPDPLYDLLILHGRLYLFYKSGLMVCYEMSTARELYRQDTFTDETPRQLYGLTSLILPVEDGFYQLRNGQSEGILLFFHLATQKWETLLKTPYKLNTIATHESDKTIWVAHQKGLLRWDPREKNLTQIPILRLVDGRQIHTILNTLCFDIQGGLWVGTLNQGMLYYHPHRFKIRNIGRSFFPDLANENLTIEHIFEGSSAEIYLQRSPGYFYSYDKASNKIYPISPSPAIKSQFPPRPSGAEFRGKRYTTLLTDHRGWVWGGTPDGLHLWIPPFEKAKVYYTEDGLVNNSIRALLEDHNHSIWASTSHGLSQIRITPEGALQFRNYDRLDGVLEGEFSASSAWAASDGTLYFGGLDGMNEINPNLLLQDTIPLTPLFVSLSLYGIPVKTGISYQGNILLEKSPTVTQKLTLRHDQNFFTLCFSALNYINPSHTRYRFQLCGVDDEPREEQTTDGLLRATYTNLSPGTYLFQVSALSPDGDWDQAPLTEIQIEIKAPFWATPWAYSLYGLVLIALVILSVCGYLRLKKQKLERHYKEEILLLRIKNLLEECNRYQEILQEDPLASSVSDTPPRDKKEPIPDSSVFPGNDLQETTPRHELLTRAIERIEQNLHNNEYSVEQLSRDLCMDRTGLYRKLTALIDKSPTLLIRSIRLKRAAQLLEEQDLPVAEVAFRVGFSSPAYLSKCFQEEYGVKPSKYAEIKRNSRANRAE